MGKVGQFDPIAATLLGAIQSFVRSKENLVVCMGIRRLGDAEAGGYFVSYPITSGADRNDSPPHSFRNFVCCYVVA